MTVVDLYTIQIVVDDGAPFVTTNFAGMAALIAEMEENLTDLLPPGMSATIQLWNYPDPDEGNDDE